MSIPQVEKIVISERPCVCGGVFQVLKIEGELGPRAFHKNPVCDAFSSRNPVDFLRIIAASRGDDAELAAAVDEVNKHASPNRRQRRHLARLKRRSAGA